MVVLFRSLNLSKSKTRLRKDAEEKEEKKKDPAMTELDRGKCRVSGVSVAWLRSSTFKTRKKTFCHQRNAYRVE